MAFEDLKKADVIVKEKDSCILELELQLQTLESARDGKESELKKKLDGEKVRADNTEKELGDVKSELSQVKEQILEQEKAEAAVISKFKAPELMIKSLLIPELPRSCVAAGCCKAHQD